MESKETEKLPVVLNLSSIVPFKGICGVVRRLINPQNSQTRALSTAYIVVYGGQESTPHFHRKTEELYYIVDGRGFIRIGEKDYPIKSETMVYIPVGSFHSIVNTEETDLRLLVIDHPPYDPEDTFSMVLENGSR